MNIPKNLKIALDSGTAVKEPKRYEAGTVISQYNETFVLVEPEHTYPTKSQWAHRQWRVAFYDRNGQLVGDHFSRHVREIEVKGKFIGTPNEHWPKPIPGLDYNPVSVDTDNNSSVTTKSTVKVMPKPVGSNKKQDRRGRPEVEMNEVKACNIFRFIINGTKPYDEDKVKEAEAYLESIGQMKLLNKYKEKLKKFIQ